VNLTVAVYGRVVVVPPGSAPATVYPKVLPHKYSLDTLETLIIISGWHGSPQAKAFGEAHS
jgi:hypothetical protein